MECIQQGGRTSETLLVPSTERCHSGDYTSTQKVCTGSRFGQLACGRHPVCGCVAGVCAGDNLAEWMLDLVVEADRKGQAAEAAALYESSELCKVRGSGGSIGSSWS